MDTQSLTGPAGPLADFSKIGNSIYLLRPRESKRTVSWTSPSLIVLLAWLDATPRHVRLHIAHYSLRHPKASLIVVFTNKVHMFLNSENAQRERLNAVLDLIVANKPSSWSSLGNAATNGILIHAFSNGGSMQLVHLERMYAARYHAPLPATTVFFDSCPGLASYRRSIAALTYSLPQNRILAVLAGGLVISTLTLIFAFGWLFRKMGLRDNNNIIIRMRADLIDIKLLSRNAKLMYLYSNEDKMIAAPDIESHADVAREKGFDVAMQRFDNSKHVAHAFTHPEQYWKVVEDRWDQAVAME